ncbi:MAG TPA: SPOR domain-containing protein [Gaiellaceae bacterium]|nr:SPOR domain-containing protein [Gaiellaceae bacterium]
MAQDDYRIRIEVDDEQAGGLLERLGLELSDEAASLARKLEQRRLVVSRDGDEVFVYAASPDAAESARSVVQALLGDLDVAAVTGPVEHWLEDEERWNDEPPSDTWEEEELEHGRAPWEVRVECTSHAAARELADRLEQDGFRVERRWRYLIAGTASREDADALAARVHGEVEPGGGLVWETVPGNPFAVFGGLGGSGTPVG